MHVAEVGNRPDSAVRGLGRAVAASEVQPPVDPMVDRRTTKHDGRAFKSPVAPNCPSAKIVPHAPGRGLGRIAEATLSNLLPAGVPSPIVFQGRLALLLCLLGQLFSASHVAAELTAMFSLDDVHFINGSLQIVSCSHRLVMKFVSTSDVGD